MKRKDDDEEEKTTSKREETRTRILSAALELLQNVGQDAVTTRAVAELAGVQAPVLYRLFGDKSGLMDALAEYGFGLYMPHKERRLTGNPVETLRAGWDRHVQFGLGHPALYLLMYTRPQAGLSSAAKLSSDMLHRHIEQVAAVGKLRLPVEKAVALFHAAALGVVVTLLHSAPETQDLALSTTARDHALSMIAFTQPRSADREAVSTAASVLEASIKVDGGFSPAEAELFREWLTRFKGLPRQPPTPMSQSKVSQLRER